MDLRIHFDRPIGLMEFAIEMNSLCILSSLGIKLKKLRLPENGRRLSIKVNSKTYTRPIKNSGSWAAQYGAIFDTENYGKLDLESQKNYLLTWLIDTFEEALNFFFGGQLDDDTQATLGQFREECDFQAKFTGKWVQQNNQRARVVIYQRFEQADIHIESKVYRARSSNISPILAMESPSVFIFQKYLQPPVLEDGEWELALKPSDLEP